MKELSEYIRKTMKAKKLKAIDVEERSGRKIADSYLSDIVNEKTKNISVAKVNALAEGMGVDNWEVFQAASGHKVIHEEDAAWPNDTLVRTMEKVRKSADLTAVLKAVVGLTPGKLKALRKQLEREES